jgi:pilus assembly protein CpaE
MPAQILVVEDDLASQRATAYALREGGYEVAVAADRVEALKAVEAKGVDLIIASVGHPPGFDGYAIAARVQAADRQRRVPILLLGPEESTEARVRAMRAGANDYISQPFHPAELLARARGLLVRFAPKDGGAPAGANGRVYAFYGAKGGVGTTTVLLNSAISLVQDRHRRVVVVDAKLQFGDVRVFLDIGLQHRSMLDIVSAPAIDADLLATVVVAHESGVSVLLAPPSPESAELVTPESLAQMIQVLRTMYDYVLVDIDQRLDDGNLQVLDAASAVFVVLTADLSSIKNIQLLLATLRNLAYDPDKVRLLLNRATAVTGIRLETVEVALDHRIDHQISNDYRVAMSALNSGAPFTYRRPSSQLARSVAAFAASIDVRATSTLQPRPHRGKPATARA